MVFFTTHYIQRTKTRLTSHLRRNIKSETSYRETLLGWPHHGVRSIGIGLINIYRPTGWQRRSRWSYWTIELYVRNKSWGPKTFKKITWLSETSTTTNMQNLNNTSLSCYKLKPQVLFIWATFSQVTNETNPLTCSYLLSCSFFKCGRFLM